MPRRIRIGVDTGGTFTDVVAFDEDSVQVVTTKTPSTPADPAQGFMDGIHKVLAAVGGATGEDGARAAGRFLRDRGVTAVGVCFLHAYANPAHERRMRDILAEEHPGAVVSISSEVLREYREYERAMTTLVDAAVKPRVAGYVATIKRRLDALAGGRPPPLLVMQSNGG